MKNIKIDKIQTRLGSDEPSNDFYEEFYLNDETESTLTLVTNLQNEVEIYMMLGEQNYTINVQVLVDLLIQKQEELLQRKKNYLKFLEENPEFG
jgi:saccharopine dehydrogenase-like NADP-dependent oxidoreductase